MAILESWKFAFLIMEDFEDLLLAGDMDGVNEVLARAGALNIVNEAHQNDEAILSHFVDNVSIPEDVYPKVSFPMLS